MGIIKRVKDAVRGKSKGSAIAQETNGQIFVSALCSAYENIFAQVRPLIDELKMVQPYGIGRNGARLPLTKTPELAMLSNPNKEMGWAEFADLMFATWLTEKELNIHVWRDGRGKIAGYTILPIGSRVSLGNGQYYFQSRGADGGIIQLSPDEVMSLRYSRNPRDIEEGISPASSVFVWTQVDDLLAQYQRAFLENGAVPASVTIIRASTEEKYLKTRKELEGQLKGAKNRNKTIYLWKQMLEDGEELDQVEVKPIQGNNSTLAIKEIMSIVNDKLNKAYGVSEFILGNDSSAKYDNAELSDRQFVKRRVAPALSSFWSQFQHELDRIFGGVGYTVSYDLEIPELTDRIKVKAEISEKNVANLSNLINGGASPKAAVLALGLPESWLQVAVGLYAEKQRKQNIEAAGALLGQNPDINRTNSSNSTSDKPEKSRQSLNSADTYHCEHCHHSHDAKTAEEITFSKDEVKEETIYHELQEIIDSIVTEIAENGVALTEEELEQIKASIVDQLSQAGEDGMNDSANQIKGYLVGGNKEEVTKILANNGYKISDKFREKLEKRTDELVGKLEENARKVAKETLENARKEGGKPLTKQELKKALSEAMPEARAETIARNETVYAFRAGGLDNAEQIGQKYNLKIKKIWHANDGACEICQAMSGKTVNISEAFPDSVEDKKGNTYSWKHTSWNDDGEIANAHVNCRCTILYEVDYD